jgi:hypothetical protein
VSFPFPFPSPSCSASASSSAPASGETDDVSPEPRQTEITEAGRSRSRCLESPDHDRIQAIARHLEGLARDVAAAKVEAGRRCPGRRHDRVGRAVGRRLARRGSRARQSRRAVSELSANTIAVEALDAAHGPTQAKVHSDAEDPNVAREEIIDQLRAQGVEGDITVDVEDGPDGRRVEVQVEDRRSE